LGAKLRALNTEEQKKWNTKNCIVVSSIGKGLLARANMRDGFVITGINGNAVKTVEDVDQELASQNAVQIEGFYPGRNGMYYYNLETGR
jgi:serine protease Do